MTKSTSTTWAVIGGGNGGQALSGSLALMGFPVRLYDIFPETIETINNQGGIQLGGSVQGFGLIDLATTKIEKALKGADIIMIVAPAIAHKDIAKACAPHLKTGQIIFIHPGATFGALEFKKTLNQEECDADVTIAESNSLLYACRSEKPGQATIFGIKKELMAAAIPSTRTKEVVSLLNQAFPQIHGGTSVMETSLGNPNAMMHPAPSLLNASLIESKRKWLYYWDGITPSIGAFVEEMDKERLSLAKLFGLNLPSIKEWYKAAYDVEADTLHELIKKNKAYARVEGQKTLHTRYLLEDIPMGLVPMVSLGKMLGAKVERMETIVKLGEYILDKDLTSGGRTMENIGLSDMVANNIKECLETGNIN